MAIKVVQLADACSSLVKRTFLCSIESVFEGFMVLATHDSFSSMFFECLRPAQDFLSDLLKLAYLIDCQGIEAFNSGNL